MSRDDATLLDILKAARLVTEFKGKLAKQAFLRDIKTLSAILHQLLVIGETFLPKVEMTTRDLCAFARKIFLRDLRAFVVKTVFWLRLAALGASW
ncbi:MAG TPA: hypothetical protein VJ646_15390 [Candidatus Binatia bacterium]|nr:hypothetical protein [Candidatus Binatia bacterium]